MELRKDSHLINPVNLPFACKSIFGRAHMKSHSIFGSLGLFVLLSLLPAQAQPSQDTACDPQVEGEGAQWLTPCKQAAIRGDGHAALMVGAIYWNGDGVAKDHAAAA